MQHRAIDAPSERAARFTRRRLPRAARVETAPGVLCERISVPVRAVGLYVPAGSAPLPSTAIMLAVPARIAGCPARVMCTPPPARHGGPGVLTAARKAGVQRVFKVGGAQAIAAMAYGTATSQVRQALRPGQRVGHGGEAAGGGDPAGAAADLPAGVTEVMVVADDSARADFVAADLLAQAEHGADAQALLVTTSPGLAAAVEREVRSAAARCPGVPSSTVRARDAAHRGRLAGRALQWRMRMRRSICCCKSREPRRWLAKVECAGAVFLGHWSPESMGDYCSGPNHTLPTYGYARAYSGLSLEDFQKRITVQELSPAGLAGMGETACTLARLEGLDAHAASVTHPPGCPRGGSAVNPVLALARPEIVALKPYSHAAWLPALTRLHANEAPWRPAGDATAGGLNRYPEPQPEALIERLAALYGVPAERAGERGSDEAIDLLSRIYLRAGAMRFCNARRPSACTSGRAHPGRQTCRRSARARARLALDPERLLDTWRPHM